MKRIFYRVIWDFYAVHGVGTLGLNKAFTVRTDQGKSPVHTCKENG